MSIQTTQAPTESVHAVELFLTSLLSYHFCPSTAMNAILVYPFSELSSFFLIIEPNSDNVDGQSKAIAFSLEEYG